MEAVADNARQTAVARDVGDDKKNNK
jgi:hypothetical protein